MPRGDPDRHIAEKETRLRLCVPLRVTDSGFATHNSHWGPRLSGPFPHPLGKATREGDSFCSGLKDFLEAFVTPVCKKQYTGIRFLARCPRPPGTQPPFEDHHCHRGHPGSEVQGSPLMTRVSACPWEDPVHTCLVAPQ